jgi:hypothetical protein
VIGAELISHYVSYCGTATWKYQDSNGRIFVKKENGDNSIPVIYYSEN